MAKRLFQRHQELVEFTLIIAMVVVAVVVVIGILILLSPATPPNIFSNIKNGM